MTNVRDVDSDTGRSDFVSITDANCRWGVGRFFTNFVYLLGSERVLLQSTEELEM